MLTVPVESEWIDLTLMADTAIVHYKLCAPCPIQADERGREVHACRRLEPVLYEVARMQAGHHTKNKTDKLDAVTSSSCGTKEAH